MASICAGAVAAESEDSRYVIDELVCTRCSAAFTPDASLSERYPGWRPSLCPSCYRSSRRDRTKASAGAGAQGASAASRFAVEEGLTLAEVLEKYHGGPDTGVFTDGSAQPNPGPGGWGAVRVIDGEVVAQVHGQEPHTTNNRMELTALAEGLKLVPVGEPTTLYTDSKLVVQTLTEWAAGWERRGWKRRTGPVENLDLVRPLYHALQARPEVELRWIKAHAGHRWNEYADSLSTAYARAEL